MKTLMQPETKLKHARDIVKDNVRAIGEDSIVNSLRKMAPEEKPRPRRASAGSAPLSSVTSHSLTIIR